MGSRAGNDGRAAEVRSVQRDDARDLVRSLAGVRGAAATLLREQESLSAERLSQLLSIIGEESALALAILRRAAVESCGEGAGIEGVLARLVQQDGAGD